MSKLVITSAFALLFMAGTAFAADKIPMNMNPGGPMRPASTTMRGSDDWRGSTTPPGMWRSSSTPDMKNGTSTRPFPEKGGFVGFVTGIGSSSFTMAAPRLDKRSGTTTLTVNVTASTTYRFASSTASFSSITVGAHVAVFGKVSTSTRSIAAERIMVLGAPPKVKNEDKGFLRRLLRIFGVRPPEASSTDSGSAAAVQGSSGLGEFLHRIFGWL